MITCIGAGIALVAVEVIGASLEVGALLVALLNAWRLLRTCIAGLGLVSVVGGVCRLRGRVCGCGGMLAAAAVRGAGLKSSFARLLGLSDGSKSRATVCANGDFLAGFVAVWGLRGLG